MRHILASLSALALLGGCASGSNWFPASSSSYTIDMEEISIRAILTAQAASWNRGDIDGFMQGYWQDEALRFASGGTVTRGWQATSDRYHARYSDKASMGQLSFRELEVEQLSKTAALVHGAWELQRDNDAPSGLFTLLFRKIDGEWMIVSDTTTSAG